MAGPMGRTREQGGGQWILFVLFFFLKKNTVYFRLTVTFRALLCSIHPYSLFIQSTRLLGWAQKPLPCRTLKFNSQKADSKATHRSSHRLNKRVLFIRVISLIPELKWDGIKNEERGWRRQKIAQLFFQAHHLAKILEFLREPGVRGWAGGREHSWEVLSSEQE